MENFRFEELNIWKEAIQLAKKLLVFANKTEVLRLYKFADQLRDAAMSISNNIAEGSGSYSDKEFAHFCNISRRSHFECVNILHLYEAAAIITPEERLELYPEMLQLSKQITNFRKTLL